MKSLRFTNCLPKMVHNGKSDFVSQKDWIATPLSLKSAKARTSVTEARNDGFTRV